MADYFTLDPAYEHYALGGVNLAFRTVYNEGYLGRFDLLNLSLLALVAGVVFARFAQLDSSADRKLSAFTIGIGGVFVVIIFGIVTKIAQRVEAHSKVKQLQHTGTLIDGKLLSCTLNTKPAYWRGDTEKKYLRATYEFTAPDQQRLHGIQIRILDETWGKEPLPPGTPVRYKWMHELANNQTITALPALPARGTPIRVLYADPETYVML